MSRKKDFWDTKATIHIPVTESLLFQIEMLAKKEGISTAKKIEQIIKENEEVKKAMKEFDKECF